MKITRECDYAIRIILMLSKLERGAVAGAAAISEKQCVPKQFTLKILRKLMKEGYVSSVKGSCGGYSLAVAPEELTLMDIVTAVDGEIAVNRCLGCGGCCNRVKNPEDCPVHRRLCRLNDAICAELGSVTMAELAE